MGNGRAGGAGCPLEALVVRGMEYRAAFDAEGAKFYFEQSLGALPEWYVAGYLAITGAIWGIAELKAAGVMKK